MRAKDVFDRGDRVRLSEEGQHLGTPYVRQALGTVIGFGREAYIVRVRWDERVSPHAYHMVFIEKAV